MADEPNPEDLEIADELIAERRAEAPGETPEDMTSWQRPITAIIDVVNYRAGQIIALMMVPLIAIVVWEVFSRNSFIILQNAGYEEFARSMGLGPTLQAYDLSRMIAGVLWMAGAGYGLFTYLRPPTGLIVELVDRAIEPGFESWWSAALPDVSTRAGTDTADITRS